MIWKMNRSAEFFSKPSNLSPYPIYSKQRGGVYKPLYLDNARMEKMVRPVANTFLDVLAGSLMGYMAGKKRK